MPTILAKVQRVAVRLIFSRRTIVLLAIPCALLWLVIVFLSASGHAAYGISRPSPQSGRTTPPVARPSELQLLPSAKQEEQLSSKPALPQPDRQEAVITEIDALEKESLALAQTLIRDFPGKSDPLVLAGKVYNRHGQTIKALEYWKQALKCNPNRLDLYDAMAGVALHNGEYARAAELCRKGLGMSTQTPHLLYQLTEALNFLGRLEESVNELQIAVRLFPENGDFHCQLGKTYMMLKEYDKAKISYETAVKLQPRSMSAYYGLFVVCTRLGMTDQSNQAMKQFRKLQGESLPVQWGPSDGTDDALSCRRGFAMTCADAGTIYLDNGMPGKAEPLLRRAAAVDPENIGCRIQLAQLLYSANRVPETVSIVRELIGIACRTWIPDRS